MINDDNYKLVLFPNEELEKMLDEEFKSPKEYNTFREEIIDDIENNDSIYISFGGKDCITIFKKQIIKVSVDYLKFKDAQEEITTIPFEKIIYYKCKQKK